MKFAYRILAYRIPILAAITSLVILSIPGLRRLELKVDISDYFIEGAEAVVNQQRFEKLFGRNEFVGILFESENVFNTPSLEKIHEIADICSAEIPYVRSVHSIANIDPRELGGKSFSFSDEGKLITGEGEAEEIRQIIYNDPSYRGRLFSGNRKEAWVLLSLAFPENGKKYDEFELGEMVYRTVSGIDVPDGMDITAAGTSVYAYRKKVEMMEDLRRVLLFGALVALLLCIVLFRSIHTVLATLSLIIIAPAIVFGSLGWLKMSADSAFISVPVLLTTGVCIGNAVHLNLFFRSRFNESGNRAESISYALQRAWRPILFTVITTITALLSFMSVKVNPVKWVGLISAACILVVYVLCMFLFPVILSLGKDREPVQVKDRRRLFLENFFSALSDFSLRYWRKIIIIFSVVALLAGYGSSLVKIDFNAEKMMGTKLEHMKDQVKIKHSEISSNEFMDLTIVGKKNWFKDSVNICRLEALQAELDSLPLVKRTTSVLQLLSKTNRLSHGRDNDDYFTPKDQHALDGLFFMMENFGRETLRKWITEDKSTARIFIEMSDFSSMTIENNIHRIDDLVVKYFPLEKDYFLSGSTYQMALMNQYITRGLVNSIGIALVLITLLMIICFGSVKLGLVAMLPNIFPVLVYGAIVGFAKIPLEFVTMTVAPLILGLAVDDTIHFISSLKTNILMLNNYGEGIEHSYREVGIAITKTTLILTCTFLVFTISDVRSTVNMGILACAGLTAAYLADIFIVPILIQWMKPFKLQGAP